MPSKFLSEKFLAPAITAAIGLYVGTFLADHDAQIAENTFFLQKQAETADRISDNFAVYIVNWQRLRQMSARLKSIDESAVSKDEKALFLDTIKQRNIAKDALFSSLDKANLYFEDPILEKMFEFRKWDGSFSTATEEELPNMDEWRVRSREIFTMIRDEIKE